MMPDPMPGVSSPESLRSKTGGSTRTRVGGQDIDIERLAEKVYRLMQEDIRVCQMRGHWEPRRNR